MWQNGNWKSINIKHINFSYFVYITPVQVMGHTRCYCDIFRKQNELHDFIAKLPTGVCTTEGCGRLLAYLFLFIHARLVM